MRATLGIALLVLAVPATVVAAEEKTDAPYVHVVIFHVKSDAPDGTPAALVKDCHELLAKIPTVRTLRVGRPAEKATEISKKDYQVGLMILFDNYEGLKTYIDHPKHTEFLERHGKHIDMKELKVFDFMNQKQ